MVDLYLFKLRLRKGGCRTHRAVFHALTASSRTGFVLNCPSLVDFLQLGHSDSLTMCSRIHYHQHSDDRLHEKGGEAPTSEQKQCPQASDMGASYNSPQIVHRRLASSCRNSGIGKSLGSGIFVERRA